MSHIQTLVAVFDGAQMKAYRLDGGRLHAESGLAMDAGGIERRPADDESHSPDSASEHGFVERVAESLGRAAEAGGFDRLVVAADPKSLGVFRQAASSALTSKIKAEIDRDYVHTPQAELEAAIAKHMD